MQAEIFQGLPLLALLMCAVVSDVRSHRIPNALILVGMFLSAVFQVAFLGFSGMGDFAVGLFIGFSLFLPFYVIGGMAAGDVKLMALSTSFLTPSHAFWMVAFTLIAGATCGLLWILSRGQLFVTVSRYGRMLVSRARIAPVDDEIAAKPFPYSVAILLGVIMALLWKPFDPWQILRYSFG